MTQFKQLLKKAHDKGLSPAASAHLDAIRGTAAGAVLLMHARHLFFIDWGQLHKKSMLLRLFYASSEFGHDAVIVFFVLSGFLIGPGVLRSIHANRWSASRYFLRRFFRLEVVLFPALLLCLAWDLSGIHLFGLGGIYGGHENYYPVGYNISAGLSSLTFWGNAAFLQTLRVPTFGSDSPLWSLTNEFWYYMLFPSIALLFSSIHGKLARCFYGILACMIAWLVGATVLLYFPIWVMGAAMFYVPKPTVSRRLRRAMLAISAVIFGCTTILAHYSWKSGLVGDYCMSSAFCVFLYFLINSAPEINRRYSKISHEMASSSYTLYVVHTPFLVFIAVWIGGRWIPTPLHVTYGILLVCAAWIYAHLIHMVFEAHTDQIRTWAERRMGMLPRQVATSRQ